jgi:hypothetical protein
MKNKLKNLVEKIKTNNDKFKKLSKEEQIVEIAKDTIERIRLKQLIPETGHFIKSNSYFKIINSNKKQFKTLINSDLKECEVCAKGALFCSYVGRVNKFKIENLDQFNSSENKNHEKLLEIFTFEQLDLIEIAFEGKSYLHKCKDGFLIEKAEEFYNKYPDEEYDIDNSEERLLTICENLINNKGVFIP